MTMSTPEPPAPTPSATWYCNKCGKVGDAATRARAEKQHAILSPTCDYSPAWVQTPVPPASAPPRTAYAFPVYACERCWHGESELTIRNKVLTACPKCGGTMREVGIPVTDAPQPCDLLCLVCARVKPWGIWDQTSGVAVCVGCRDKARSPATVVTAPPPLDAAARRETLTQLSAAINEQIGQALGQMEQSIKDSADVEWTPKLEEATESAYGALERVAQLLRLLPDVLAWHHLTGIECNHEARTDVATCGCAMWRSDPQPSAGAAVEAWVAHVCESLGCTPPRPWAETLAELESLRSDVNALKRKEALHHGRF